MFTVNEIMEQPFFIDKKGHAIVIFPKGCEPRMARRARLVMWASGEDLSRGEVVHHIDERKANDDPTNLRKLMAGEHTSQHCKGRKQGGSFQKGNTYGSVNAGREVTWADKISAAKLGKKLSPEHRLAISLALQARKQSNARTEAQNA